jgi:hypothetical protein
MKTVIATLVAAALTATPAFAGEFGETAAAPDPAQDLITVAGLGRSGSGVIDGTVESSRATDQYELPAGGALGQGPASVHGGVPAGAQAPALGEGGLVNQR